MTLYKVTCSGCDFYCGTDSHLEALKVRNFHFNWNMDDKTPTGARIHHVRIAASVHAVHHGRQALLEDVGAVLA